MNEDQRTAILTPLRAENPEPTTELDFGTPFELLIAVVLSAQATDVGVNRATTKLFPVARTPPPCWSWAWTGSRTTSAP